MNTRKFLKRTVILLISISSLLFLDIVIVYGGLFTEQTGTSQKRSRSVAQEQKMYAEKENLKTEDFQVKSLSGDTTFRKKTAIEVSCDIKNTALKPVSNFRALIRTPEKEIITKVIKLLNPKEKVNLSGTWTPERIGVHIIACRADSNNQIDETTENDNREIVAVYILP